VLEEFGVDPEVGSAYRVLLSLAPTVDVSALAASAGRTPDDVATLVDGLVELGLAERSGEFVTAVAPEIALPRLLERQRAEVAKEQERLSAARSEIPDLLSTLGSIQTALVDHVLVERFVGVEAVRAGLAAMESKSETSAFQPPGLSANRTGIDRNDAGRPLDRHDLRSGVRVRCLFDQTIWDHATELAYAAEVAPLGVEHRVVSALPMRMVLVDRAQAFIPVDPLNSSKGAYLLKEPGMVGACSALFEAYWAVSEPLVIAEPMKPGGTATVDEHELLRLLADGTKDDAVARQLGVSVRTVRRQIAELMERLGASSRFEAGVMAVQRGWL
jgi:DNA-binding CsgD family transcriptional regulator